MVSLLQYTLLSRRSAFNGIWFENPIYADFAVLYDFNNNRYAITTVSLANVPTATAAELKVKREATFDEVFAFTATSTAERTYTAQDGTLKNDLAANVPRLTFQNGKRQLRLDNAATNILLNSATVATQSITVSAVNYTLSFTGTGSITLSGVSTAGPLAGTGANDRVQLSFTPTAGSLTLTVAGDVRLGQLETGPMASAYIPTAGVSVTRAVETARFSPLVEAIAQRSAGSVVIRGKMDFTHSGSTARYLLGSDQTIGNLFFATTTTTISANNGATSLTTSSLGANWYKNTGFGVAWAFDGTGRSLVGNGGTVATDANAAGSRAQLYLSRNSVNTALTYANGFYDFGAFSPDRLSNSTLQAQAVAAA